MCEFHFQVLGVNSYLNVTPVLIENKAREARKIAGVISIFYFVLNRNSLINKSLISLEVEHNCDPFIWKAFWPSFEGNELFMVHMGHMSRMRSCEVR